MKIENIPGRKLPGKYSVVEFGVGSHPFPPAPTILEDMFGVLNPYWSFKGKRNYTGIDMGPAGLDEPYPKPSLHAQREAEGILKSFEVGLRAKRPKENIRFVFGDVLDKSSIDIPDGSVNEILITNVLSSGMHDARKALLLERAAAMLTEEGLLVVRETFTPRAHPPEKLSEKLQAAGFEPPRTILPNGSLFESLTAYYGPTQHDITNVNTGTFPALDRYFCITQPEISAPETTP